MKKVLVSLMLLTGVYGLSFSQQGTKNQGTGSQQGSSQEFSQEQGTSISQDPRWEKIGEKTVDLRTSDKESFDWDTQREKTVNANEVYSEIKFRCTDIPVDLTNVEVVYANGQKQDLTMGSRLKVNSESKSLSLNSRDKLDKIDFNFYKNDAAEIYKANIEVWGLKANKGSGMGQSSKSDQKSK